MDQWPGSSPDDDQQSASFPSATPAGWYHAEGDPAGTSRYWDGAQWSGGPVALSQAFTHPQPYGSTAGQAGHSGFTNGFPMPPAGYGDVQGGVVELSPLEYWLKGWKDWNKFDGRSRRAEYWYFSLFNGLIAFLMQLLIAVESIAVIMALAYLVFAFASLIPGIAVGVRRMHDTNRSGWWLIVPFVGLIFSFIDGDRGPNSYGLSPKYPSPQQVTNTWTPAPIDTY